MDEEQETPFEWTRYQVEIPENDFDDEDEEDMRLEARARRRRNRVNRGGGLFGTQ